MQFQQFTHLHLFLMLLLFLTGRSRRQVTRNWNHKGAGSAALVSPETPALKIEYMGAVSNSRAAAVAKIDIFSREERTYCNKSCFLSAEPAKSVHCSWL